MLLMNVIKADDLTIFDFIESLQTELKIYLAFCLEHCTLNLLFYRIELLKSSSCSKKDHSVQSRKGLDTCLYKHFLLYLTAGPLLQMRRPVTLRVYNCEFMPGDRFILQWPHFAVVFSFICLIRPGTQCLTVGGILSPLYHDYRGFVSPGFHDNFSFKFVGCKKQVQHLLFVKINTPLCFPEGSV
jgi:hypothetical protein